MAVFGGGGWVVVTRAQSARTAGTQGPGTGRPHVPRCYAAVYGSSARAPADPVVCDADPARHPILAAPSARMDDREKKQRTHAKKNCICRSAPWLVRPANIEGTPLRTAHVGPVLRTAISCPLAVQAGWIASAAPAAHSRPTCGTRVSRPPLGGKGCKAPTCQGTGLSRPSSCLAP